MLGSIGSCPYKKMARLRPKKNSFWEVLFETVKIECCVPLRIRKIYDNPDGDGAGHLRWGCGWGRGSDLGAAARLSAGLTKPLDVARQRTGG